MLLTFTLSPECIQASSFLLTPKTTNFRVIESLIVSITLALGSPFLFVNRPLRRRYSRLASRHKREAHILAQFVFCW